ncbi:MAG: HAMP domain-containing histidine kinase [Bacteroidetes bacterium]|nr:HAMP domain-containing histidine kinase [Bacteroidota bacterium]
MIPAAQASEQTVVPVNFNEIFRQSVDHLRYTEGIDKIQIEFKEESIAPFAGNRKLLALIFNNLISNGIKYRKITGDQSVLKLTVFNDKDKAILHIQDNGIGIAPDETDKIFSLFNKDGKRELGRGMGLFMTKEIIEKLGGKIMVESVLNVGTAFTIEIPNRLSQSDTTFLNKSA